MRQNAAKCNKKEGVLNDRHYAAIEALAGGSTKSEVCGKIGVNRSTLARWMENVYFLAALNERRSEIREVLKKRVAQTVDIATDVVINGLRDPKVPTVVKLRMSCAIIHKLLPFVGNEQYGPHDAEALATQRSPDPTLSALANTSDHEAALRLLDESRVDLSCEDED